MLCHSLACFHEMGILFCFDVVVGLNLICSFAKMRSHLGLKDDVKADMVPEDVVLSVAETLKNCSSLKISEDGEYFFSACLFLRWRVLYFK